MTKPPARLVALQHRMGRQLSASPRVNAHGFDVRAVDPTLRLALAEPPPGTATLDARVALYRTQHWQRLLRAMQEAFPRATQVVGPFAFNRLTLTWLLTRPPRTHDLGACADGFAAALQSALASPEADGPWSTDALPEAELQVPFAEALRLDEAVRRAFAARWTGVWRPTPAELKGLLERHLVVAPSLTVMRVEHAVADADAIPERAPVRLAHGLHLVVYRTPLGTAVRAVPPTLARLVTLSRSRTLGEAVAALEAACAPEVAALLGAHLPEHLRDALEQGWWVGVADAPVEAP